MELFRRYIFCLILSYLLAFVISITTGNHFLLSTGDFPAFYSAAYIMRENPTLLYKFSLQQDIQNIFWEQTLLGRYYPYVYPPFYAFILIPLSYLRPEMAKVSYVLIMFLLMGMSIWMHRVDIDKVSKAIPFWMKVVYFLLLAPNFIAVVSGQNTALSLFIFALFLRFYRKGTSNNELVAGVCLGFLAYKPHFAILVYIFMCFVGRIKVVMGILLTLSLLFLLNTHLMRDWLWPIEYIKVLSLYQADENHFNILKQVSIFSTLEYFGFSGNVFRLVYGFLTPMILYYYSRVWKVYLNKEWSEWAYINIVLPLVVLLAPHVMFYEFGLLLFPFLFIDIEINKRKIWMLILIPLYLLLPMFSFAYLFYYQILGVVGLSIIIFSVQRSDNKHDCSQLNNLS